MNNNVPRLALHSTDAQQSFTTLCRWLLNDDVLLAEPERVCVCFEDAIVLAYRGTLQDVASRCWLGMQHWSYAAHHVCDAGMDSGESLPSDYAGPAVLVLMMAAALGDRASLLHTLYTQCRTETMVREDLLYVLRAAATSPHGTNALQRVWLWQEVEALGCFTCLHTIASCCTPDAWRWALGQAVVVQMMAHCDTETIFPIVEAAADFKSVPVQQALIKCAQLLQCAKCGRWRRLIERTSGSSAYRALYALVHMNEKHAVEWLEWLHSQLCMSVMDELLHWSLEHGLAVMAYAIYHHCSLHLLEYWQENESALRRARHAEIPWWWCTLADVPLPHADLPSDLPDLSGAEAMRQALRVLVKTQQPKGLARYCAAPSVQMTDLLELLYSAVCRFDVPPSHRAFLNQLACCIRDRVQRLDGTSLTHLQQSLLQTWEHLLRYKHRAASLLGMQPLLEVQQGAAAWEIALQRCDSTPIISTCTLQWVTALYSFTQKRPSLWVQVHLWKAIDPLTAWHLQREAPEQWLLLQKWLEDTPDIELELVMQRMTDFKERLVLPMLEMYRWLLARAPERLAANSRLYARLFIKTKQTRQLMWLLTEVEAHVQRDELISWAARCGNYIAMRWLHATSAADASRVQETLFWDALAGGDSRCITLALDTGAEWKRAPTTSCSCID